MNAHENALRRALHEVAATNVAAGAPPPELAAPLRAPELVPLRHRRQRFVLGGAVAAAVVLVVGALVAVAIDEGGDGGEVVAGPGAGDAGSAVAPLRAAPLAAGNGWEVMREERPDGHCVVIRVDGTAPEHHCGITPARAPGPVWVVPLPNGTPLRIVQAGAAETVTNHSLDTGLDLPAPVLRPDPLLDGVSWVAAEGADRLVFRDGEEVIGTVSGDEVEVPVPGP